MIINQAKTAKNLEVTILGLDPLPEDEELIEDDDELLENDEELFIEEQKDKNKIPEELAKEYFKNINSSVLPF